MSPSAVKGTPAKVGVPQDEKGLDEVLGVHFSAGRRVSKFKSRLNERIKKLKDWYGEKMKPDQDLVDQTWEAAQTYCEAHRGELTADGTKSKHFQHGTVGWRKGNWYHVLTAPEQDVIAELERRGLDQYVIVPPKELDVQKLVRDRETIGDTVTGLGFDQDERFYIEPPKDKKPKS